MRFAHPITTVTAPSAKKNTEKLFEDDSANERERAEGAGIAELACGSKTSRQCPDPLIASEQKARMSVRRVFRK